MGAFGDIGGVLMGKQGDATPSMMTGGHLVVSEWSLSGQWWSVSDQWWSLSGHLVVS